MKTIIYSFLFFSLFVASLSSTPLSDTLNALWIQKNYAAIKTTIETKAVATPKDLEAVYCSIFYYTFIEPSKVRAYDSVEILKNEGISQDNQFLKDISQQELNQLNALTDEDFIIPTVDFLNKLHQVFPKDYPGNFMGIK